MLWAVMTLGLTTLTLLLALVVAWRKLGALKRKQAAATVQGNRPLWLDSVLAAMSTPVLVVDAEGECLEEYPADDRVGRKQILARLSTGDRAALRERLRVASEKNRPEQLRLVAGDRCFDAEIVPLPPRTQVPGAAAVVLRDVTDQERSATALGKLAVRNEAILRSAMDGFFVVGEDHRFLEVNEAFCRMTGYRANELLRMRTSDLEVNEPPRGLAASTYAQTGLHQFATAHRHKDGHVIQLEISVIALRDDGRKILVGFARDVTERVRAEEALRESEERYRYFVEHVSDGVWCFEPPEPAELSLPTEEKVRRSFDAVCVECNTAFAAMYGRTRDQMIGRRLSELMPAEDVNLAYLTAFFENGCRIDDAESRELDANGNTKWFLNSMFGQIVDGKLVRLWGRQRDITERKQAEEERRQLEMQAQRAQKLESLGILAGGIAHDFNNFLVSILGNASLALEQVGPDSALRACLQKIVNASRRASDVTRQMLAYSGRATYDVHPMDLNQLVSELADFMRAALPKTVTPVIQLAPDLPPIEADGGQIQQVLMNLLINGAEAIGDRPGVLTVSTSARRLDRRQLALEYAAPDLAAGEYVCLEVSDTGCGMATQTLARIFDPFFTTKATGRGLGLATILGIVRGHHGAVKVASELNRGTMFTVLFPAAAGQPRSAGTPALPARLPAGATVLVIDDEEDIRDVVRSILESRGASVLAAENGRGGIELFRKHADGIDLVLLDMTMPGIGGDEVFDAITALRPATKVILSSGYSEQEAVARFGRAHLAGFVQKPYTADMLVEKVAAALHKG